MDISSKGKYPANKLTNFATHEFVFEGITCLSMEGLLQSFKFKNIESQKITCLLSGSIAKIKGSERNKYWKSKQTLWWKGKSYRRSSKEYQKLLDKAFTALYTNEKFKQELEAAGIKTIFTHKMGKSNKKETVLTESEFCKRLQRLKDFGKI